MFAFVDVDFKTFVARSAAKAADKSPQNVRVMNRTIFLFTMPALSAFVSAIWLQLFNKVFMNRPFLEIFFE